MKKLKSGALPELKFLNLENLYADRFIEKTIYKDPSSNFHLQTGIDPI